MIKTMPALSILFVTPEATPWVKTGGLGDVSAALPTALAGLDCDVRVLLPAYRDLRKHLGDMQRVGTVPARGQMPVCSVWLQTLPSGAKLLLLDAPELYDRGGGPYQDSRAHDWPDNVLRFGCLSHAAAWLAQHGLSDGWRPQLLHCHDWQAALAPAYLDWDRTQIPSVFTIHNLAFQGLFPTETHIELGLPPQSIGMDGLEFYGKLSFIKGGLQYASAITTVSPTYANEIQEPELGFGLDGLLRARSAVLHGIVNGIDIEEWNPAADSYLSATYDAKRLNAKAANKLALQKRMGLAEKAEVPLFGVVSRFTAQKGTDLIAAVAPQLARAPAQLIMLGSGETKFEQECLALHAAHPRAIAVKIGFDEGLAHAIEAGADFFLMPSRFEPCGLNQMYSQRYGTPPICRATGGLADTVVDCTPATLATDEATGFLFGPAESTALHSAITRALAVYGQPDQYRRLQQAGMRKDFSWTQSARRYRALYSDLIAASA